VGLLNADRQTDRREFSPPEKGTQGGREGRPVCCLFVGPCMCVSRCISVCSSGWLDGWMGGGPSPSVFADPVPVSRQTSPSLPPSLPPSLALYPSHASLTYYLAAFWLAAGERRTCSDGWMDGPGGWLVCLCGRIRLMIDTTLQAGRSRQAVSGVGWFGCSLLPRCVMTDVGPVDRQGTDGWMDGWMAARLSVCLSVYVCLRELSASSRQGSQPPGVATIHSSHPSVVSAYVCMFVCEKGNSRHDGAGVHLSPFIRSSTALHALD